MCKGADVIKASCGRSNLRYEVYVRNEAGTKSASRIGRTDSSGRLKVDMTKKMDIKSGHIVYVNCQLPAGDVVSRRHVID